MDHFECKKCGACCKNIRARYGKIEPKEIEEHFEEQCKGKNGIYQLLEPSEVTIPLFEWEVEALSKEAKKRGFELKVKPYLAIYDIMEDQILSIRWILDYDDCPFYTDEGCSVYSKRPLVCRFFPIDLRDFTRTGELNYTLKNHMDCKHISKLKFPGFSGKRIDTLRFLDKFWGDSFVYNFSLTYAEELIIEAIGLANQNWFIRLGFDQDYWFIKNRFNEKGSIGLFEFLAKGDEATIDRLRKKIEDSMDLDAIRKLWTSEITK